MKETLNGRSRVNVKLEPYSAFTFARDLLYIASIFIYARKIYVRTHVIITRQWKSTLRHDNVETELRSLMHSIILLLLENSQKVVFLYPMNKIDISPFFKAINQGVLHLKPIRGCSPPKGYLFQASGI